MEAWSSKVISFISNCLRKPLIMDEMAAKIHDTSRYNHKKDNAVKLSGSNVHGNRNGKKQPMSGNNDMRNMNNHGKSSSSKLMGRGNGKGKEKVVFRRKQNHENMQNKNEMANIGSRIHQAKSDPDMSGQHKKHVNDKGGKIVNSTRNENRFQSWNLRESMLEMTLMFRRKG
uniref:Uncharacterized protein n=1 Tax=Tanacetum cinerariifolium TaxID=118510 RepID=A0A6L2K8V1_TANCI|nr:hypothetical protein [Tanacetum cinerariifolium]